MAETKARARVRVVLEIDVADRWGDKCDLAQVYSQARESAVGKIRHSSLGDGGWLPPNIRIVGEPEVLAVLAEKADEVGRG